MSSEKIYVKTFIKQPHIKKNKVRINEDYQIIIQIPLQGVKYCHVF